MFSMLVDDWIQEVYVKLIQHDGVGIRSFRGETESAAFAFLATTAKRIVLDYIKAGATARRSVSGVALDEQTISDGRSSATQSTCESELVDLIDVERFLDSWVTKNHVRDRLVFTLHYRFGMTLSEIACLPQCCGLSESGIKKVLGRLCRSLRTLRASSIQAMCQIECQE